MNDTIDAELRRRFATQVPVPADEAFVALVRGSLVHRRRLRRVQTVLGIVLFGIVAGFTLSWLQPLFELLSRGASALSGLALDAPSSLPALATLGAVVFAVAVVAWALRRI